MWEFFMLELFPCGKFQEHEIEIEETFIRKKKECLNMQR